MSERIIGIMGAIPQEINGVVNLLTNKQEHKIGRRSYFTGELNNQKVVVVFSRVGKVAASATVTTLILEFKVSELIFTGVAGGIHADVKIGDIVLGQSLIQHDMNAQPLFPAYEIPMLGKAYFEADSSQLEVATTAILEILEEQHLHNVISEKDLDKFNIHQPQLHVGLIGSGDLFFSTNSQKEKLQQNLPEILCVEMEGAAVAQVCYEFDIPFIIIRTISDDADDHSTLDFNSFIEKISNVYSIEIIKNIIK
ncbi:5'-methylthioadenosine/adenosylhomocysteine nucleosidase [Empedobacter falsenii]|uniref:5'-methylthioadenosine/adenosylhomocysteine nucleosidase n=1 Tax=Empedobacter TaxID=59734 RepID=UPI0025772B9E|nr:MULTISPECIES: 5'-methylthioadenosine/adenosylhomocysteine nucleosidase [Empedobacter]MDM1041299.1 5'-methylthioadenosine/adenosylhomocysteine nucleosidase [Empedobacter brevis]MDM1134637.1 5'-methylthioadenosine/adenosylhomocysteine nucleosidase [Empedobacter sp. R750]MDM1298874.1 5'-methylthioadenosine/adenosylhomocysteine nucleosidase [Empedobacter falsenii]MDM1318516.1 5'-methylthioadenosine/adenosylhomocysteine nucleosidase [Empedobacter falsenii]